MTDIYPVPPDWAMHTRTTAEQYAASYDRSLNDADIFWLEEAARLDWIIPPTRASESSFHADDFGVKWFADGLLNVSVNCIDRHLRLHADRVAIIWEPDIPSEEPRHYTYQQLHDEVCRLANVLKKQGVQK